MAIGVLLICELVVVWLSLGSKTTWYGLRRQRKLFGKMKLLQEKLKNNLETYSYITAQEFIWTSNCVFNWFYKNIFNFNTQYLAL